MTHWGWEHISYFKIQSFQLKFYSFFIQCSYASASEWTCFAFINWSKDWSKCYTALISSKKRDQITFYKNVTLTLNYNITWHALVHVHSGLHYLAVWTKTILNKCDNDRTYWKWAHTWSQSESGVQFPLWPALLKMYLLVLPLHQSVSSTQQIFKPIVKESTWSNKTKF